MPAKSLRAIAFAVASACAIATSGLAFAASPESGSASGPASSPPLLQPIDPEKGIPLLAPGYNGPTLEELEDRAIVRGYEKQIKQIRRDHFGKKRGEIRTKGFAELAEFTDAAAFMPMVRVLSNQPDDVRIAVLDHFAGRGEDGQVALARIAMTHDDHAMRYEAERRLLAPAPPGVLNLLDISLRGTDSDMANAAGHIVGALNILEAIPTLIYAQASAGGTQGRTGPNIAWIFFGKQEPFVTQLVPIVGDGAGAFQPVIGTVQSGVVMEVRDAVVIVYRTIIHYRLTSMTTNDWGGSTDQFGYNLAEWREWYNNEYVPYKNEQIRLAELEEQEEEGT